jgi:hypothetical protein
MGKKAKLAQGGYQEEIGACVSISRHVQLRRPIEPEFRVQSLE